MIMTTSILAQPTALPASAPALSASRLWTGRILSTLAILFMLMDSVFKFVTPIPPAALESMEQLGWEPGLMPLLGVLALGSTLLYLNPRTALLGAVLLTGYFGGAIATHLRVDNPLFSHTLFPVYIALLVWGGLALRDPRVAGWLWQRR